MSYPKLKPSDLVASNELSFNRKESAHPQLMRLCIDFDLVVLQLERKAFSHISKRFLSTSHAFVICNRDYRNSHKVFSPWCDSLMDLEIFARRNHVNILHEHLFGETNSGEF